MLIRNVVETDFTSCIEITHRAWPELKERESIFHLFCKFFNTTCFVCEKDKTIEAFLLGFISQVDKTQVYIHLVAVDPSAQRQGYARQLYYTFFKKAEVLGAKHIRLIVNPDNLISLAFHKKLGFEPDIHGDTINIDGVTAVKDYNGSGIHMVPFIKHLT